jgi:type II secretory pathway component PulF
LDLRSRTLILRSLATLLGAGVNLSRGLHLLTGQGETRQLQEVCRALEGDVARGFPLYEAMRRAGPFSQLQIQLVRVAEETGGLVEVLRQLAAYEERTREVVMRVRSSLTYPVCLFLVCIAMLILVPPFLLKGQLELLRGAGEEPPAITLLLVTVAGFLGSLPGLLALGAGLTLAWWSFRQIYRSPAGRLWLFRRILSLPRIGPAMRLFATARFARALALQLQVGLSVLDAVPAAGVIASNPVLERSLPEVRQSLEEGVSLTESLRQSGFFPQPFLSLLTAGEESGKLPATLGWVARLYELELESELEMACAALEPLMMMGMGLAAGLICLATMLPLVKLIQTL